MRLHKSHLAGITIKTCAVHETAAGSVSRNPFGHQSAIGQARLFVRRAKVDDRLVKGIAADPAVPINPLGHAARQKGCDQRQTKPFPVHSENLTPLFKTATRDKARRDFGTLSTLKAWIDYFVWAGRSFAYSQNGPEGLLKGNRAIIVIARGGVYSEGPAKPLDLQEPYLRAILGFIGINEIDVVRVEGVAVSAVGAEKAMASAMPQSYEILAKAI